MNDVYLERALKSLKKPQEIDRLQKILIVIRKEVEWPAKRQNIRKLYQKGHIKYIIVCLQRNHVPIVNITLSILSNCCMDRYFVREVMNDYGVLTNISYVVKRYSQDSIRGRSFRLIGNICQQHDYRAVIFLRQNAHLQIVTALTSFLKVVATSHDFHSVSALNEDENLWSNATICMAIRAIRELLRVSTIETLVQQFEVIKIIGMIAIKYTPKWMNTQQHADILEAVLKLLLAYSKHNSINLIPELQNCGKGNAMDYLGKLLILSPYVLVKIIMNLLKTSSLRSDLPIMDMSGSLIQKLGDGGNFVNGREDLQHREYLKCLSFLLHHPANKEDLRNNGLISGFISVLRDSTEPTEISLKNCILILSAFRTCMYDEISLLGMLKCDIINVLISKFNWAVGTDNNFDLSHAYKGDGTSKKRRKFLTDKCFMHKLTSDGLGFPCCSTRSDIPCNYIKYNKERSTSPPKELSLSSGPSSPVNPVLSENDDSDDYSPVCSDSENDDSSQNQPAEEENVPWPWPSPYYEDIEMPSAETGNSDGQNIKKLIYILCNEIVKLLKLFTKLRPVVMELVTTDLLLKLLSFLFPKNADVCPPDTLAVILSIVETPEYLLRLMQTEFVTATYKLSVTPHGSDCITCTNLYYISRAILFKFTIVVESGSGKGDIAHQLLRANLPIKERLVSSIPFVTGNKYIFVKLMIDCGGLNILLQSFQLHSSIQQKCICSLCVLAIKLGIKNPAKKSQEEITFIPVEYENYQISKDGSSTVSFKLDDGSVIQADREFLSEKSEYFKCLLSGVFKESVENEIALHNISNKAFKLLLILLQFDIKTTEIYQIDANLELLLDVIALSESYLLTDLCNSLTLSVQYFNFLPSTIPKVYQWSLESGTDILRIESVAYALVAEMTDSERCDMFCDLLGLGCTDKLADDIRTLLTRFLQPARHLQEY